ncbi:hypothetical protein JCGZ_19818 [Jatropha curcas]|uniref:Uncharacterized protein n=1 Tax=Jatropha curcas TaxID=180498 RepID=A0A067JU86_JATCU|nr:hypothetical protein JCGZ_19818 [Jatropha curcas]
MEEDLALEAELRAQNLKRDWSWVDQVYPDGEEEEEDEPTGGDLLLEDPPSLYRLTKTSLLKIP